MARAGVARRRRIVLAGTTVVAIALACTVPAARAQAPAPARGAEAILAAAAPGSTPVYAIVREGGRVRIIRRLVAAADADGLSARMRALPGVVAFGRDGFAHASEGDAASLPTNDPGYSLQWALQAADYQAVWPLSDGSG